MTTPTPPTASKTGTNRPMPRQLRRLSRSGNPQVRAGIVAPPAPIEDHDAPTDAPAPALRSRVGLGAKILLLGALVSLYTTAVMFVPAAASSTLFIYAMLALVPLTTMVFVRDARTRGLHRWPTVWALSLIVHPTWVLPVLFLGQTWALARAWLIESGPQRPEFWPTRPTRRRPRAGQAA